MIHLSNVNKQYNDHDNALTDINVDIDSGEFVYLVGPSGAGKSTFIRLLYHATTPTTGQVVVNDTDLTKLKPRQVPKLRRHLGVVFQDFKLLPRLTIYENVAFALQVIKTPPKHIPDRVQRVLELVGIADKAKAFPDALSGGEQQRAALARAIVNQPLVLLADEPTGNLDPETSDAILTLLEQVNRQGTTVVMATHDRDLVNSHPHRVLEIVAGKLVRDQEGGLYSETTHH
ncbi:cell division ATP-binding protein FtsE [Lacticaseibacillus saniviri]|uniref:Cell division ATP-binding protein FtsE n=1 Tax=Lacticaseibacillus saniviri JCM 17471 = DSM 24301 TaxID=1293598 RepID=A0A0R2MT47_9LACO|nr:cell division ATP-binding protein FtsE [Lacticaseibacillus saniviri]KRO16760.1 Cell division ATPase [Lacticaseibacillus saniviri JCM 17471 = DSM 24301]MCG4281300.1 cell division ATP-binding protein FtsE [Lacticaseibacillus saniviri]